MKLLSTLCVLVIAIGCSKQPELSLDELNNAVENFNEAFVKGDTTTLAEMITENYVHTNSSWKPFGRETWLSYMKSRRGKLDNGTLKVSEYTMDEYAVESFENTAIVTARITSQGIEDNEPFRKQFRVTNVWVYQNGNWLRASFHDTAIE